MEIKKVIFGKDNWLFLQNDTNQSVEQNAGVRQFTPSGIKKWVRTLETRTAMLKDRGIQYYFLVAPNKESVYPEYLPDGYIMSERRPINQIIEGLSTSSANLWYPLNLLKLYKSEFLLYSQVNTHWNARGGYIAYKYLADLIKKHDSIKVIEWDDIIFEEIEISEDLGSKLNPPQTSLYTRARVKNAKAQMIYDNGEINSGWIRISLNKDTTLPTAIVFHDSFTTVGMVPFIMESFSWVQFVHTPTIDYDLIDKIKPDVVISEMVERFLISIPSDY